METFPHWDLICMGIVLAVVFGLELLGVFCPHYATLTDLIKSYIPMPCRWMLIAWLFWHFIASDIVTALGGKLPIH